MLPFNGEEDNVKIGYKWHKQSSTNAYTVGEITHYQGYNDPPTIIVLIIPEAIGISKLSRSLTPRAKIFGNMIELKKPIDRSAQIPTLAPRTVAENTKTAAIMANTPSITFVFPFENVIARKLTIAIPRNIRPLTG